MIPINELDLILNYPNILTLLIAPPAWGKTHLLKSIIFQKKKKVIFISPLKALALEFYFELNKIDSLKTLIVKKQYECNKKFIEFHKIDYGVLIITPECLNIQNIQRIHFLEPETLFVFDEFHLFYSWGINFRPILFETLCDVVVHQFPILALSATITDEMKLLIQSDFKLNYKDMIIFDYGNMKLKNKPVKTYNFKGASKQSFKRRFFFELTRLTKSQTYLYFCQYRQEVDALEKYLISIGKYVLTCKGGEVDEFCKTLDMNNPPQVIISTSCLSHGVNLPQINKVFIDYEVSKSFLVQMIGRGGRKGEAYNAYHCNSRLSLKNYLFDQLLKLREFVFSL